MTYPLVTAVINGSADPADAGTSLNLAAAFSGRRRKVLLVDTADGQRRYSPRTECRMTAASGGSTGAGAALDSLLVDGPSGILVLPASSLVDNLGRIGAAEKLAIFSSIESLNDSVDVIIVNTRAETSNDLLFLDSAAHNIVVSSSTDPESLKRAVTLMQTIFTDYRETTFKALITEARSEEEGLDAFRGLSIMTAEAQLPVSLDYLGSVPVDEFIELASFMGRPVVELFPESASARAFLDIAAKISDLPPGGTCKGSMQFFWRHMLEAGRV